MKHAVAGLRELVRDEAPQLSAQHTVRVEREQLRELLRVLVLEKIEGDVQEQQDEDGP
jgi:hypothetical protein